MSNQPTGRTFKERWPEDAAYADWLSSPWVPLAGGGLAGFFGLPLTLGALCASVPWVAPAVVAILAVATWAGRRPGRLAATGGRLWILAAWALLMGAGGLVVSTLGIVALETLCGPGACGTDPLTGFGGRLPVTILQAGVVVASMAVGFGSAMLAVRARERWIHPPRVPDPEGDAWRDRRLHHEGSL